MVRKAKKAPNAAKMYRHFAVVTVVITAAVALMVDSDSRRDAVEVVADNVDRAELKLQSDLTFDTGSLVDKSNTNEIAGDFGDDSWVGITGSGSSSSVRPTAQNSAPPWVRLGMSRAEYEMLAPEEQQRLLAQLGPAEIDRATMARISDQSMRRAGRTEPSQDAPDAPGP